MPMGTTKTERIHSIADVVDVEVIRGNAAVADSTPCLLVEVPHGADERQHYDRLQARMKGSLPADLHAYFHINTDVGAWACGRAVALRLVEERPDRSVLILRSLIPRTFIDCNRPATKGTADAVDVAAPKVALSAGIPPYIRDPDDLALLQQLHGQYVDVAAAAFAAVCGQGGLALVPHTYGPRSMGIPAVDDDIVKNLRWACEPERVVTWPLRADIDLLTRDGTGRELSPPGMEAELLQAFGAAGFAARANDTYYVHESSLAWTWSTTYPGQLMALEVRRDLLVPEWRPFEETFADPAKTARVADVLAPVLDAALKARGF